MAYPATLEGKAMASININVDLDDLPTPTISDDQITSWIEARLNDARNLFVMRVQRGEGSGVYYKRGRGRGKRRSAPGEYPVTEIGTPDAGRLANSVATQMHGPREGSLFSDVQYARYLTEGTAHMEPRRMLHDALTEVLENRPATDRLVSAARLE